MYVNCAENYRSYWDKSTSHGKLSLNAERTYDINVEKYRNGALTGMELKNQQTQLTDAKNALTDAIISYKLRLLDLKIQTLWDFQNNKSYLPVDLLK